MKPIEKTSVIIVTFNHRKYIENCLKSLLLNKPLEIIVVDNKSTDGTPEYIEENFPQVKLIRNNENLGYGAANNIGVQKAQGKYMVILNPDTKVEPHSLELLINPLESKENLVTIPKVLFYDGQSINTCGNIIHFTGLAFTRGIGENPGNWNTSQFVNGLSGVCFAITKENYVKLGGFDENIFHYMEDSEFSWRLNAYGFKILYIPECVIYHSYDFKYPQRKYINVEKGRYIILRKYLSLREYILLCSILLHDRNSHMGLCGAQRDKRHLFKIKSNK